MAVLASDPIPTFREDEDGNDVWLCMFVFGKSLRNKQRPGIHLAQNAIVSQLNDFCLNKENYDYTHDTGW